VWDQVPRSEIFLATKFGYVKGPSGRYYYPTFMREQCERSLRNMRTDVIDVYYFHHCRFGDALDDAIATAHQFRDEGKVRFIGLSDWDSSAIMQYVERVDPDVVQPYRNLIDDQYESSGLKKYVDDHDLGVAFFSPLMHGLLLGKYTEPHEFPEGDFRRGIAHFQDAEFIKRMQQARDEATQHFANHREPVLHAAVDALLTDNPTATVLLGQRNAKQVEAAAKIGEALSRDDAEWVRRVYRG